MTVPIRHALAALLLTIPLLPTASFAQAPNITATKTDGTPAATKKNPGETVTYTNVITNAAGAGTATGLQFTDPDVAGSAVVAASVKVSPIAFDDVYTGVIAANTTIDTATSTGFNILANDFQGLAAGATATLTISTTNVTSANGGTVVIAAGGTFSYSPAPGFVGSDSFNYTITNNNGTLGNSGSVSLTVSGPVVWHVNAGTGNDTTGNGTLGKPFATVNKAATVDAANHKIFIATGTYAGTGVTLESNEMLIGQGSGGGTFDAFVLGFTPTLDTLARPILGGTRPILSGGTVITLAAGNTIRGLDLNSTSAGSAISGSNITTATIGGTPVDTFITSSSAGSSGVNLNGGSGAMTIHAPIHATAGAPLSIASRTGGTVTVNGKVSSSGTATALNLASNGATTINLHSVVLSTDSNTAFSATGSGTLTLVNGATDGIDNDGNGGIDEADEANTLATTSGTALNLNGVNVGAGHLTFQSIASNGGSAAGIIIRNTGSSPGTVFVTGTGTAGSGGTIQNKSGSDVSSSGLRTPTGTTDGTGIYLGSAGPVSLDRMNLQGFSNFAIYANGATGFKIDHSTIGGTNGDNVAQDEGGMRFLELAGSCSFLNSTFGGNSITHVMRVVNTSGTLGLTVNGSTFTNPTLASGDDGLFFEAGGTATITANVFGNTFTANRGDHFQAAALNSGNLNISFKGNTLTGGHPTALGAGVTINAATGVPGYAGTVNYDIDGNTINGAISNAVIVNLGTSSSAALFNGFIRNNLIGTAGSAKSGSLQANGIGIDAHGNGTHTCAVTGNTVIEAFDRGVSVLVNDGTSGVLNLTVQGNDLDQSLSNDINGSRESFFLNNGSTSTNVFGQIDAATVRLNFGGAGALANLLANGVGSPDHFRVRQRFQSRIEMPGYAGTPFDNAAVVSYLSGRNTLSGGATASATSQNDAGSVNDGYFAVASVPFPSSTPLPLLFAESLPETDTTAIPTEDHSAVSHAVPTVATAQPATTTVLQAEQLDTLVAEAISRWEATGLTGQQMQILRRLRFELGDLNTLHLGQANGDLIRISPRAAGNEWFIDSTPADDIEFSREAAATRRTAISNDAALNRVDLLTTLLHEMGHALGLCDNYSNLQRDSLMYGFLGKGERRVPGIGQAAGATPHEHNQPHFLAAPIDIGVLPPGKSVTIIYDVVINDPLTTVPLTSQGTVSGTNFTSRLTDDLPGIGDPALPGAADPTVTLIERPNTTVASINRTAASPTNASSVSWQIVFANPVNGLTSGNFSLVTTGLSGAPAISGVTAVGGTPATTWTVTATSGSGSGSLGLNLVNDTGLTYDVTNQPFPGQVYALDLIPPVFTGIARLTPTTQSTNADSLVFRATFSESVANVNEADFTVTGTSATVTGISGSGSQYDITVSGGDLADLDGTVSLSLGGGQNIADAAGNALPGTAPATNETYTLDNVAPTVAITSTTVNPAPDAVIPVTVTFSESVNGFDLTDINITGGSKTNFAGSGAVYTYDLTPTGPGVTVTADIAASTAQDAAGNENTAATQFTRTIVDAVSIAATTATAVEGGATGLYTFTRGSGTGDLTVNFQLDAASTATAATDFTLTGTSSFSSGTGTIIIPDGQLTTTVTLTALIETPNPAEPFETARLNVVAGSGYVVGSSPSAAVTLTENGFLVTTTADSGTGSLRQAVLNANSIAGTDTITFDSTAFTNPQNITLSSELPLASNLTIQGPTASVLTIIGGGSTRLFAVAPGGTGTVTLSDLVLSNGNVVGSGGGLIVTSGTLNLLHMQIVGCTASSGGGAIFANLGTINIVNSSISGNTDNGTTAGGGMSGGGARFNVYNSTVSGNSAPNAISNSAGGIRSTGITDIRSSTITNNSVAAGAGNAGGVSGASGSHGSSNSIIAGNVNNSTIPDIAGSFFTGGNNLIGNRGTATNYVNGANGDQVGTGASPIDPLLGSLANNGGRTLTHALLSGSPALNAGNNLSLIADTFDLDGDSNTAEVIDVDQRGTGFVRAIGTVDIGAFELQKSVSIANAAPANESDGGTTNFVFTITRTGDTTGDVNMTYAVGGAAVNAADFGGTLPTGTATITAGNSTTTVTIPVSGDTIVEPDEAFSVTLSAPDNGYVISGAPATSTINNDDAATISIATITNGVEADVPSAGKLRVELTAGSSTDTTVSYSVTGTASSGTDFNSLSGSVTVPAGQTTADIDVTVLNESTILEPTETVNLTLGTVTAGNTNITVGSPTTATMDITDDDTATVTIAKITDGAEPATNTLFRVTQTAAATVDTIVTYTVGGTATIAFLSNDFTRPSGSVTILAGQTTADISVDILDDNVVEPTETLSLTLTGFTARDPDVSLGAAVEATANIVDDDTATAYIDSPGDGNETIGSNALFFVRTTKRSSTNTTIAYTISGTAANGTDFTTPSGSVTIVANSQSAVINVGIIDDAIVEGTENISLTLTAVTAANTGITLGSPLNASANIVDNDAATVSVAKITDGVEAAVPTNALFRVTQTAAASTDTVVTYSVGGNATSGTDFTAPSGSVTILAGQTTADISVAVINEIVVEPTETVSLTLTGFTARDPEVTLGGTVLAAANITDNDTSVITLTATGADQDEGTGGASTAFTFSATLSNPVQGGFTIAYTTADGTALAGSDYTDNDSTLTFTGIAAESKTITVLVNHDGTNEINETFTVALGSITGTTLGSSLSTANTPQTGTIRNDDALAISIAAADADADADENTAATGTWRVSRNGLIGTTSVQLVIDPTSTASAADWNQTGATFASLAPGSTGTAVIPDGVNFVDITLTPVDDLQAEAAETVRLNITADSAYVIGSPADATVTIGQNDFLVTNTNDAGEGTLRQAILNHNFLKGANTVTFSDGTGGTVNFTDATAETINLASELLVSAGATDSLILAGPGPDLLTLQRPGTAGTDFRILHVASNTTLQLSGVTITGGKALEGGGIFNFGGTLTVTDTILSGNSSSSVGGGICNRGTLTITSTTLSVNSAFSVGSFSSGGGIYNDGTLSVLNSTFSGNSASSGGGGIYNSGTLTVANSTFSGNTTNAYGGGIREEYGTLTVINSTLTANSAGINGGGIFSLGGGANVKNSIIAGNSAESWPDLRGAFTSSGGNVIGNVRDVTVFTATNDLTGTDASPLDPVLGPLADNGGPTLTHVLLNGSPAINNGLAANLPADVFDLDGDSNTTETLPVDQRGTPNLRTRGPAPDSGAVEAFAFEPSLTAATTNEDTQSTNGLVITANTADGGFTTHYKITGILKGTLFTNNGTTAITSGNYITKAEGLAGLKFTPEANLNTTNTPAGFSFSAQAAVGTSAGDERGAPVPVAISVNAVNDAPAVVLPGLADQILTIGQNLNVPLGSAFTDIEGNPLNFTVQTNSNSATASAVIFKDSVDLGGLSSGTTTITILADDGQGGTVTDTFLVSVGTVNPTPLQIGNTATLNRQNGLFELFVNVTNTTPYPINGFRLRVDYNIYKPAHPSLILFNASSPAGASDVYLDYPFPVAVDGVVTLNLSFYTNNRRFPSPFMPGLSVESLGTAQISGPLGEGVQPTLARLPDRSVRLEFVTVPGKWYRVRYSADLVNWFTSELPVQATGNLTPWIDKGPPYTNSDPAGEDRRFYLINEIPAP